MRTFADYFPIVENDNHVGVTNSRKPVRDDEGRPSFHKFVDSFLNFLFGNAVKRACRFVQNNYAGIFENRPSDGNSLFFSAGKTHASFANERIVTFRHFHNEFFGVRLFCRPNDSFSRRAGVAVSDIRQNRFVVHGVLLQNCSDIFFDFFHIKFSKIYAVYGNCTFGWVYEPRQ